MFTIIPLMGVSGKVGGGSIISMTSENAVHDTVATIFRDKLNFKV